MHCTFGIDGKKLFCLSFLNKLKNAPERNSGIVDKYVHGAEGGDSEVDEGAQVFFFQNVADGSRRFSSMCDDAVGGGLCRRGADPAADAPLPFTGCDRAL